MRLLHQKGRKEEEEEEEEGGGGTEILRNDFDDCGKSSKQVKNPQT